MTEEKLEVNWEQLNALTAEVISDCGPGDPGWDPDASHTKRFNEAVIEALRANGGKAPNDLEDVPLVIVHAVGAKSGLPRTVVIAHWNIDGRMILVASMGGARRNPPWFYNLKANPHIRWEVDGQTHEGEAYIPDREERDEIYGKICDTFSVFAEYQERTERIIPVVELRSHRIVS